MMSDLIEQIARKGHEIYERLAPEFGYETRQDTKEFNPDSPNGKLMIAVYGEIISLCNQSKWVSVAKRFPDKKGWYLVTDKDECIDETWISEFYPKSNGNSRPYFSFVGMNGCDKPDDTVTQFFDVLIPSPPDSEE